MTATAAATTYSPPIEWVKAPRQARTQATLERFLDTAEELLNDRSFDQITVSDLTLRARSSVGAFYRRFKDKDGLLHALHERYCEEAAITAKAALDGQRWVDSGIGEIVGRCLSFVIQVLREHHGLDRAVYIRALTDETFRERSGRLNRHVMEAMAELLLERRAEITHPHPEVAVDIALRQVFSFFTDTCTVDIDNFVGLENLSDQQIADEATRSFLAYLGVQPLAPS